MCGKYNCPCEDCDSYDSILGCLEIKRDLMSAIMPVTIKDKVIYIFLTFLDLFVVPLLAVLVISGVYWLVSWLVSLML